jgi:hypothetical protein
MEPLRGSCLCGEIVFVINGKFGPIGQCHCSKCRKVSGTDGNAVFYTAARSMSWVQGQGEVITFSLPGTKPWGASRCGKCGSPAPHLDRGGKFYYVPAGLLDDDPGYRGYAAHIHVASKGPWVVITDDAPQYPAGFDSEAASE